jgi:hypothetical protein
MTSVSKPASIAKYLSIWNRSRRSKEGLEVQFYSFFNLGAAWGWVVNDTPRLLTPGKDLVPIEEDAGWAPGPVWTGAENLASTGIRSQYRPARSESL